MMASFAGPRIDGVPSENVINQGDVQYMLISPSSGRNNQGMEISADWGTPTGITGTVLGQSGPSQPALAPNVQHHVVATYDKTNTSGGANPGGTMALYLDGVNILPGGSERQRQQTPSPRASTRTTSTTRTTGLAVRVGTTRSSTGPTTSSASTIGALTQAEVTANFARVPCRCPSPQQRHLH